MDRPGSLTSAVGPLRIAVAATDGGSVLALSGPRTGHDGC